MSQDPVRWKDDGGAPGGLRDLMRQGTADAIGPMPANVRAAILAELPPAPPAPPAPPNTAPVKSLLGSPAGAGIAVLAVAAAVALVVWKTRPSPPEDAPVAEATPVAAPAPSSPSSPIAPVPVPAPAADLADVSGATPEPAREPAPAVPAPSAAKLAPPPKPTASESVDTLAAESALIGRARANLAGSPASALAAIDEHARRFPRGELATEREYLRVSALRRLGRTDEAKARGKKYLAAYPSSPYAPAVRRILEEIGAP